MNVNIGDGDAVEVRAGDPSSPVALEEASQGSITRAEAKGTNRS